MGCACDFLNEPTSLADVAFMVPTDWNEMGLGTALQAPVLECALAASSAESFAEIMPRNA